MKLAKLTIKEMKEIAHDIIDEEAKKYNIEIFTAPLTFGEYFEKFISKKGYNTKWKIKKINNYRNCLGVNNLEGVCFIYISHLKKIKTGEKQLLSLVTTCFHEARHSEQDLFSDSSYERFIVELETIIRYLKPKDYIKNHDKYSYEIGANLYGIKKAKEYIQKKVPDSYSKLKFQIEKTENIYKHDYLMYDASGVVDIMIANATKAKDKTSIEYVIESNQNLQIFFNNDGSFKSMEEIICNSKLKNLDFRIIATVLSSQALFNSINLKELETDEITLLIKSLKYTAEIYKNQNQEIEKAFKSNVIPTLQYLEEKKTLVKRMSFVNEQLKRIIEVTKTKAQKLTVMTESLDFVPRELIELNQSLQSTRKK